MAVLKNLTIIVPPSEVAKTKAALEANNAQELKEVFLREYMDKSPMPEVSCDVSMDTDWEFVGDAVGGGKIYVKRGQRRQWFHQP